MRTRSRRMNRLVPVVLVVFLAGTLSPGCFGSAVECTARAGASVLLVTLGATLAYEGGTILRVHDSEDSDVVGTVVLGLGTMCLVGAYGIASGGTAGGRRAGTLRHDPFPDAPPSPSADEVFRAHRRFLQETEPERLAAMTAKRDLGVALVLGSLAGIVPAVNSDDDALIALDLGVLVSGAVLARRYSKYVKGASPRAQVFIGPTGCGLAYRF